MLEKFSKIIEEHLKTFEIKRIEHEVACLLESRNEIHKLAETVFKSPRYTRRSMGYTDGQPYVDQFNNTQYPTLNTDKTETMDTE